MFIDLDIILTCVEAMVRKCKTHPLIMMLNMGNFSGSQSLMTILLVEFKTKVINKLLG